MEDRLQHMESEALSSLAGIRDTKALEEWYRRYLGKKGTITDSLRGVGRLPTDERPRAGQYIHAVRERIESAYQVRREEIESLGQLSESVDITLPGRPTGPGTLHLSTKVLREIYIVFSQMGFQVFEAPDVETDEYNFELLNMPPYHPARDMWDTFWVSDSVLLRTHTSPGQIRAMRQFHPEPIRVILPGKCYRYEQITARSEHQFFQVEGLALGHAITLTDLKGTMIFAARQLFGAERKVRFRGSYFPFTEPSVEVDMDCILCKGQGCRVCKYSGWLEIAGAGMVHPVVLENGGYDPAQWTGFAFGMGVERPAMLKHNIDDIRYFYRNDLRFLRQFA